MKKIIIVAMYLVAGFFALIFVTFGIRAAVETAAEKKQINELEQLKLLFPAVSTRVVTVVLDPFDDPNTEKELKTAIKIQNDAATKYNEEHKDDKYFHEKTKETYKGMRTEYTRKMNEVISKLPSKSITVVDRNKIDIVMSEHKFQVKGLTSEKNTAELGKFLNADYVCIPTYIPDSSSDETYIYIRESYSFMNVNTLEKIVFNDNNVNDWDVMPLIEKKLSDINGKWLFLDLKAGKFNTKKYAITPFVPVNNPLKTVSNEKEKSKYQPADLDNIFFEGDSCLINNSKQAKYAFATITPRYYSTLYMKDPWNNKLIIKNGNYVTDAHIGQISIKNNGENYISGEVYALENQLAILVGQKKDTYYFLMFNKAD